MGNASEKKTIYQIFRKIFEKQMYKKKRVCAVLKQTSLPCSSTDSEEAEEDEEDERREDVEDGTSPLGPSNEDT